MQPTRDFKDDPFGRGWKTYNTRDLLSVE